MAEFVRKTFDKFRRKWSSGDGLDPSNVSLHGEYNERSDGQIADKSEFEESLASVSGNRADAESSDFECQPKQAKKKKRSQPRSKSVGSRPSAASESSGPEAAEQENKFRDRSKSADSGSTAIKPFQKNVGSSEDNLSDNTALQNHNKDEIIDCLKKELAEKEKALSEKEKALAEKEKALTDKDKEIAALKKDLAAKKLDGYDSKKGLG